MKFHSSFKCSNNCTFTTLFSSLPPKLEYIYQMPKCFLIFLFLSMMAWPVTENAEWFWESKENQWPSFIVSPLPKHYTIQDSEDLPIRNSGSLKVTNIRFHYDITQSIFTALNSLCTPPVHPSSKPSPKVLIF